MNWLDGWISGLVDAKVENSVACHRISGNREVCVNEGQRLVFARDRAFKFINDRHIAFWVNVNDKDA